MKEGTLCVCDTTSCCSHMKEGTLCVCVCVCMCVCDTCLGVSHTQTKKMDSEFVSFESPSGSIP
mgnify:CR=1 FL=1